MLLSEYSLYADEVLTAAAESSGWLGRSGLTSYCFAPENAMEAFAAFFAVAPEDITLTREDEDLRYCMERWLGAALKTLEARFGRIGDIAVPVGTTLFERLAGRDGLAPYFFLEGLFFVRFEACFLCIMVGNNE